MKEVSAKIKWLRLESGLTLKQMSDRTGLSISFLSQVERGTSSLAIDSLKKIADALEVNMTYFFEEQKNTYIVRKENQRPIEIKGLMTRYTRLNGQFPQRSLAPYLLTLSPKQRGKQTFKYSGEEFFYCLKGEVIFHVDNKEYHLKEGDAIHFPAKLEHYGENPLDEETILLGVITPVVF